MATFTNALTLTSFNAYNNQSYGVLNAYWNGWGSSYGFAGNRPSVPCSYTSVFKVKTGSFLGAAQSLTFSFGMTLEYASTIYLRASLTSTEPTSTSSYIGTTLGADSGRLVSGDVTLSGIESTETTFNITLTSDSIQPNKTYYLVLSPYPTSNSSYAKVLPASFSGYVTYSASATVVSAGSGTIGSSLAITMTNDGMSHELTYSFEGVSGTIGTTTSSSYTWAVPVSLAGQIPAATSGTCRITCTSDAGSTYVDITLTVPDVSAFRPSISSVSISLDNSMNSTVEGWGIYLQGFSKLIINAEATAGYSTIASWRIDYIIGSISGTGSGASLSLSQTSPILMQPGMYPVSLTVTDARGRIATADDVDYFTVHAYSTPNITDPVMYRCTSDGVRDDENGTYLYSSGTPTFSSCDGHNSVSTQFEYKERSAANYVSAAFGAVVGGGSINVLKSYNMRIVVRDALNTFYYDGIVSTQAVSMNIKPAQDGGVCFGGYAQEDKSVELADGWKLRIPSLNDIMIGDTPLSELIGSGGAGGGGSVSSAYPVGAIFISTVSTNPSTLLGFGVWKRIEDTFLLACGSAYSAGSVGGEATHQLTNDELPSHSHSCSHSHDLGSHTHGAGSYASDSVTHFHYASLSHAACNNFKGYMMRDNGSTSYSGEYAAVGSSAAKGFSMDTAMSISVGNNTHSHSMTGTSGAASGNTGSYSGNTGNTGSGSFHNNMPPYLAVYVWERMPDDYVPATPTYSVSSVSGATYGFALNANGYYESANAGVDSSYSICKLTFNCQGKCLYLDCINYAEGTWDFGLIGNVDSTLSLSNSTDSSVLKSFSGLQSADVVSVQVGAYTGEHYLYIKYKKDSSVNKNNDSLQFKVRFV